MTYPKKVKLLKEKLDEKGLWHSITRNLGNQHASTCWDASIKRNRLGDMGIEVFSELKSNMGYIVRGNVRQYVMLHCRGSQLLDDKKIKQLLHGDFIRMEKEELASMFDSDVWVVNPFLGFEHPEVLQVFDTSIVKQVFIPYTMMTNASDFLWGVEFVPAELIAALEHTQVADIVQDETKFELKKHKIGILTGNSPESGILLWEKINTTIREQMREQDYPFLGDLSFPHVLVESVPDMGLSMELELRYAWVKNTVESSVRNLCERGATIVCVACNTTQYFSDTLQSIAAEYGAKYIPMAEATEKYLRQNKIEHFDFLGIGPVVDFEKWSAFKVLDKHFKIEVPNEDAIEEIAQLGFLVKKEVKTGGNHNKLENLIKKHTKTSTVLVALTELSILLEKTKNKKIHYIHTLDILAEAVSTAYLQDYRNLMKKAYSTQKIEIRFFNEEEDAKFVFDLLKKIDKEFVPKLSQRESITQKELDKNIQNVEGIQSYYRDMLEHKILVAYYEGKFVGFVVFVHNYLGDEVNYISTIGISKKFRGHGITRLFYDYMFYSLPNELYNKTISTRTWSTNVAHITILNKLNFTLSQRIKDDRGVGIDTMYYTKEIKRD